MFVYIVYIYLLFISTLSIIVSKHYQNYGPMNHLCFCMHKILL